MKNMKKVIMILTMFAIIILIFCNSIYAFGVVDFSGTPMGNPDLDKAGNKIITVISTIGSIVSVIVLVIIGIKYMLGSVEEKAEYKKTLLPYVIGAGLVFAASAISGIIFGFTQNLG